jgi:Tol biopolymer transport system component
MRNPRTPFALAFFALLAATASPQSTTRISTTDSGGELDGYSSNPLVSPDGRFLAFDSDAAGLVADDSNGLRDVFLVDRTTGAIERVDVATDGAQTDGNSSLGGFTPDGRVVLFFSDAANLTDQETPSGGYYVRDRQSGTTELVSVDADGAAIYVDSIYRCISADGRWVFFAGATTGMTHLQIFGHDRTTGATEIVSVDADGVAGDDSSSHVWTSADGGVVVFESRAKNLVPADRHNAAEIYLRDRGAGTTERLSNTPSGDVPDRGSEWPLITPDGRFVVFVSYGSDLVAGDTNGYGDVFVLDRISGRTECVSVATDGTPGDRWSGAATISADGRFVAFTNFSTSLVSGDLNQQADVFLRDRAMATTERVSISTSGTEGDGFSGITPPSVSDDGRFVVFDSVATTLVDGDTNGKEDAFMRERPIVLPGAAALGYGEGFAGSFGTPFLAARTPPVVGCTCALDVGNSLQGWTVGLLLLGVDSVNVPTRAGGTLLVDPIVLELFGLTPWGTQIVSTVPDDPALIGVSLFAQVLELDSGAAHHLSFTPGLELQFGH